MEVTVVGGGLAGSEAALQLGDRGVTVRLLEMRPHTQTGVHRTGNLAEVVCSNSFKSTLAETASGLLKAELGVLGCRLLGFALECSVPAGHALAVDRELFARSVTDAVESHPKISVTRRRVESLEGLPLPAMVATGPLTGDGLSDALRGHCSAEHLYFYDAIAPSLDGDSIDTGVGFWASRYGKGTPDYFNVPLDRDAYVRLLSNIRTAAYTEAHAFEEEKYFEACLPVEVLAKRGDETLRHGPLKPRGLVDPRTGEEPYAVIQLRRESRVGNLLGMVGFQTRMTWPSQKATVRALPGFERAEILRYGTIHRNIYLCTPEVCEPYLADRKKHGLYYAGQICGVEGYVESIASALVASLAIFAGLEGRSMPELPAESMLGALMNYVHTPNPHFQPMNANMGIIPFHGRRRGGRRARNRAISNAAVASISAYREDNAWLF